jgi:fumarate reductase subunit C
VSAAATSSRARRDTWLWLAQRLTGLVLAPLVLVHLATILYAVRGGLSAAEVLARTQGSAFWAAFYGLFVLAAAVHGGIGLRAVLREWAGSSGVGTDAALAGLALLLMALGLRALAAVVA